jgi:hypothetical protein
MADEITKAARMATTISQARRAQTIRDQVRAPVTKVRPDIIKPRPEVPPRVVSPPRTPPRQPAPAPTPPAPAPPVVTAPPPAVPLAPSTNPFDSLPMPSPGDRIKADDFKKLSQSLLLIRDAWQLSASLMGRTFGDAKQALVSQQYLIASVMSVFGHEIADENDPSLDSRKVIQVVPLELGEKNVAVVVTEAVETRRTVPNLLNLTYAEASERLESVMGDITVPSDGMSASQLVGLSLAQAKTVTGR